MMDTRVLSAAAVAVFMLGVIAGYMMSGTEVASEPARFKVKSASMSTSNRAPALPMVVALDVLAAPY